MPLPTLEPPSIRLPKPCFLSSPKSEKNNLLLIVVVDGAGDHHTRLNPTFARLLSPVTPVPFLGRPGRLRDPFPSFPSLFRHSYRSFPTNLP